MHAWTYSTQSRWDATPCSVSALVFSEKLLEKKNNPVTRIFSTIPFSEEVKLDEE